MKFPDFSIFYNRKNEIFADQWGGQRGWRDDFDLKGLMYDNLCYYTRSRKNTVRETRMLMHRLI